MSIRGITYPFRVFGSHTLMDKLGKTVFYHMLLSDLWKFVSEINPHNYVAVPNSVHNTEK